MKPVIDFALGLGAWNWFILAALMMLLETLVPGVHFMWFGIAAVAMGGLVLVLPMPVAYQLVVFALVSLVTILFARRYWGARELITDAPSLNERGQQYVGRTVTVVETIENGRGKVAIGDTVWVAEGPDSAVGSTTKVTGVNGTVLRVG
jgi:inner membrane protein